MSFISVLAKEEYLTIMSDGQVTKENGDILFNNFQKFKMVNENQFIAITGDYENAVHLFGKIEYSSIPYPLNYVVESVKEEVINKRLPNNKINSIIIGGIDLYGEIVIYKLIVEAEKYNIDKPLKPKNGEIVMSFLTSDNISDDDVECAIRMLLNKIDKGSPDKFLLAQKVSENDATVNNCTYYKKIVRTC